MNVLKWNIDSRNKKAKPLIISYAFGCYTMEKEVVLRIERPARDIWNKIRNTKSIKSLISEIDRIDTLEENRTYLVWFRLNLGIMEKRYQTILETNISDENLSVDYFINSRHIEVRCSLRLKETSEKETEVRFTIATRPKNALGKLIELAIYEKMDEYKENIKNLI